MSSPPVREKGGAAGDSPSFELLGHAASIPNSPCFGAGFPVSVDKSAIGKAVEGLWAAIGTPRQPHLDKQSALDKGFSPDSDLSSADRLSSDVGHEEKSGQVRARARMRPAGRLGA